MRYQNLYYGTTIREAIAAATTGNYPTLQQKTGFNFVSQIASGRCLLIGEGNLSFARSLLHFKTVDPARLTATTYHKPSKLSEDTLYNARHLIGKGATVKHGINARTLATSFAGHVFSTIVFQFPHTGRRPGSNGKNPNYLLVRDFLKSARNHLGLSGRVCISAVDSPHYQGAFQFETAALVAGYNPPSAYPFDPKTFKGYTHTMTHDESSALRRRQNYKTWVFKPKI